MCGDIYLFSVTQLDISGYAGGLAPRDYVSRIMAIGVMNISLRYILDVHTPEKLDRNMFESISTAKLLLVGSLFR